MIQTFEAKPFTTEVFSRKGAKKKVTLLCAFAPLREKFSYAMFSLGLSTLMPNFFSLR